MILDFWAEWCGPCRNDLPGLGALHKKHPEDIVVIGIHPPGSTDGCDPESHEGLRSAIPDLHRRPRSAGGHELGLALRAVRCEPESPTRSCSTGRERSRPRAT